MISIKCHRYIYRYFDAKLVIKSFLLRRKVVQPVTVSRLSKISIKIGKKRRIFLSLTFVMRGRQAEMRKKSEMENEEGDEMTE